MAVLRKEKKGNFTVIDNAIFKDRTLSLKAKGLLCQMLSLPDGWEFSVEGLSKLSTDGRSAVASALNELQKAGYFRRENVRIGNRIAGVEYVISEVPNADFLIAENLIAEKLIAENQAQLNTNKSNTNKSNTNSLDIYKGLSENLIEALKAFEEMRKKIKSPMTDRAKSNLLGRLDRLAGDDEDLKIELLDAAILNNWKNVYPPKENDNGSRNDARRGDKERSRVARTTDGSDRDYEKDRARLPGMVYGFSEED